MIFECRPCVPAAYCTVSGMFEKAGTPHPARRFAWALSCFRLCGGPARFGRSLQSPWGTEMAEMRRKTRTEKEEKTGSKASMREIHRSRNPDEGEWTRRGQQRKRTDDRDTQENTTTTKGTGKGINQHGERETKRRRKRRRRRKKKKKSAEKTFFFQAKVSPPGIFSRLRRASSSSSSLHAAGRARGARRIAHATTTPPLGGGSGHTDATRWRQPTLVVDARWLCRRPTLGGGR